MISIGRLSEGLDFLRSVLICLWEAVLNKPLSCPPCWKCTLGRLLMGVLVAFLAIIVLGDWFPFALGASLVALVYWGDGRWQYIREWLSAILPK